GGALEFNEPGKLGESDLLIRMRAGLAPFLSGAADTRQLMGENTRKDRRTKVLSMTVRYRSATLGEFIEHHSYDVSRGGMFIKTPSPFPAGTLLKFEVKIADEQRVMQGVGRVVWKRDTEGDTPEDPAGMGIKFIKIDDASRSVIDKLVNERGGDSRGAYDRPPENAPASKKMFPDADTGSPAPDDPTVMKPADQLLKDALQKTGEMPKRSASSNDDEGGFEPVKDKPISLTPPPPQDDVVDEKPASGEKESGEKAASSEKPKSAKSEKAKDTKKKSAASEAQSAPRSKKP